MGMAHAVRVSELRHRAQRRSYDTWTACAIGTKGEARTLGLRAPSGPYIHELKYMGWVQLSSLVRPKIHGTACAIGPTGEARTLRPRVPSVQKVKLGHSDRVRHRFQRQS